MVKNSNFPEFWYSGNRYIPSDRTWIERQLNRLGAENQKIAADQYSEIYKKDTGKATNNRGRVNANKFLLEFCNKYGISKFELETEIKSGDNFRERIERIKALKPRASIIEMAGR